MDKHTSVGLIECGRPQESFVATAAALPDGFRVKKAFAFYDGAKTDLQKRFPELEWVADCNAILQDNSIVHLVISAPSGGHRSLIGAALKANKHVQVV